MQITSYLLYLVSPIFVDLAEERQDVGAAECRLVAFVGKYEGPPIAQILAVLLWSAVPLRLYTVQAADWQY